MIDWICEFGVPIGFSVVMGWMLINFLALVFGAKNAANKGRWDE